MTCIFVLFLKAKRYYNQRKPKNTGSVWFKITVPLSETLVMCVWLQIAGMEMDYNLKN